MYNTVLIAHGRRGDRAPAVGRRGLVKGVDPKTEKWIEKVVRGGGVQKGHQGCVRVKEVCCHSEGGKIEMGKT